MKKILTSLAITTTLMCNANNPFNNEYKTPHGTVPFNEIKFEHFEPAIFDGLNKAKEDIKAIAESKEIPTFENTIVALDNAGLQLSKVMDAFGPLLSALSDDNMMQLSLKITPELTDYYTSISLNEKLWDRVKYVYDHRKDLKLDKEDEMLLTTTYDSFVRSGALLKGKDRERFGTLMSEIAQLTTLFGQNVLKELNTYEIILNENQIAGLPQSLINEAKDAANAKGKEGSYLFTLAQPTYIAVLKNSTIPEIREKFYKLYTGRNLSGEYSNTQILKDIANKRLALANLMGFETFSDYALQRTMAQRPQAVYELLNNLRDAYVPAQKKEFDELQQFAEAQLGFTSKMMPWDYSFVANKLKQSKYSYDEEALRPYFELDNTIAGVFGLATKLYGITFRHNPEIPVYHPDVKAFEAIDADGSFLGVIYTDFFPRETKRPGAWMTEFKGQWTDANGNSRPHVSIVMNFTKPTATTPSLLTPYEVETFLHEFGHAIHGLLANTKYRSLSGTNVYRDFVELPSQFNENFLTKKEYLDSFAKHYLTGQPIPDAEVEKIVSTSQFGAAYSCLRQLSFGYIDMAWHTITKPVDGDVSEFENKASESVSMFAPVENSLISPQFSHIFSGGYASGYYSYKWAEVLDADAFAMFEENGIFDKDSAQKFRDNVLSKGGTENPADLYRKFRGRDASIDALLHRDGISKPVQAPKTKMKTKKD